MKQVEMRGRLQPGGKEARILLQPYEIQPMGGKLIRALRLVISTGNQTICELHLSPTGFAKAVTELFSAEIENRVATRRPSPGPPRRPIGSVPQGAPQRPSVAGAVVEKGATILGRALEAAAKDWISKKFPGG